MDYLEATQKRSVSILLNGKELEVRRANLGLHYRLSAILDQWQEARNGKDYRKLAALTFQYTALATGQDAVEGSVSEIMLAFILLQTLNQPSDDLPFMRIRTRPQKYEYDYENRALANWVTRLANHYGWTAHYVLNKLTPEEAVCYMQEALIQEHEDKEFLYRLSGIAYKIEGKGKSARPRFVPFPKPSWMAKKLPKILIPKTWLPQGNIIEAGDIRQAGN